ncbi:MAG: cation:proton antiporter, partial [Victivallaceae bacterium]
KLQPLLEFESGSNDPMAAFLTIFMVSVVTQESSSATVMPILSYWIILPTFLFKMTIGITSGWLIGKGFVWLYNKINFDYDGLYYVLSIVAVLFAYSIPELLQGNGFMAVYVAGMVMGNNRVVFCRGVGRFYDGLAWIMQVILFAMLGLLAFPRQVWEAKYLGLAVAIFLMVAARPLATFICLIKSEFSLREKVFISWVGLRGGAPIMLATFPMMGGVANSELMFHIVFFIVITSVLLQGMTLMPLAKLLKLDAPLRKKTRTPLAFEETMDSNAESYEFSISDELDGVTIAQAKFPAGLLVLLVKRDTQILVPRGETKLQRGDTLTVLGDVNAIKYCKTLEM